MPLPDTNAASRDSPPYRDGDYRLAGHVDLRVERHRDLDGLIRLVRVAVGRCRSDVHFRYDRWWPSGVHLVPGLRWHGFEDASCRVAARTGDNASRERTPPRY